VEVAIGMCEALVKIYKDKDNDDFHFEAMPKLKIWFLVTSLSKNTHP